MPHSQQEYDIPDGIDKTFFYLTNQCYNNLGVDYYLEKDYVNMEKYYMLAVGDGDSNAMVNLGRYYQNEKKDYINMEKYYMMAIDYGETCAMYNIGVYYQNEKKDYANMEKYYMMAIDNGDSDAMFNLGLYYHNIEDYDN